MTLIATFLSALTRGHTWNLARNPEAIFGLLWGLPIPVFALALEVGFLGWQGRTIFQIIQDHPIHIFFLAHPLLFLGVFGALGTLRGDIETRNRELLADLERQALTDPLTGAWNRRYVMEELGRALERARREGTGLGVAMFDMDNFKQVNDREGHLAGDKLLKDVAAALREEIRRTDTLGRYGGDEFLLVAPGPGEEAASVAERAEKGTLRRTGFGVTCGVAAFPADGETPAALIGAADARMAERKKAKKAGR